jgi:hypothetical protein
MLLPFVRQLRCSSTVEVTAWHCQSLSGGTNGGVYRIWGEGQDQEQAVSWSLILKVLSSASGSQEITAATYWKREALVYQSGLLSDLPGALTAPQCFGISIPPRNTASGDELWVWLEDIQDDTGPIWPSHLIALAARTLGQFNGGYLQAKPLPTYAWLSQGRMREWLERSAPVITQLPTYLTNPTVRAWLTDDSTERILALWSERERFLTALERVPRTLCHHDAFRRNLLAQRQPQGHYRIVAIDWELVGTGVIGEELANFVALSLAFLDVAAERVKEFETTAWEAYLGGLTEAGWQGDLRLVRFGYIATAALLYGVAEVGFGMPLFAQPHLAEQIFGHSIEKIVAQRAQSLPFLLKLGDEARELLKLL